MDRAGDDTYTASSFSQGAALFGLSLFLDYEGSDRHGLGFFGQGAQAGLSPRAVRLISNRLVPFAVLDARSDVPGLRIAPAEGPAEVDHALWVSLDEAAGDRTGRSGPVEGAITIRAAFRGGSPGLARTIRIPVTVGGDPAGPTR